MNNSIFNAIAQLENIPDDLEERYKALVADPEFIDKATINTSDGKTLYLRFQLALDAITA